MGIRELRIHGVGGAPGPAALSVPAAEAVTIYRGRRTRVLARRSDQRVQAYDWGRLTTDSPHQPLWVLLLPFTLINVAGWAHGHFAHNRLRLRLTRALVHLAAVLLTAGYVLWAAIIGIDYLGYQALGRINDAARLGGVLAGFLLTAAVPLLLLIIADATRRRYERVDPGHGVGTRDGTARWKQGEDLVSEQFFAHDRSLQRLLGIHGAVIAATVGGVVVLTVLSWGGPNLGLGRVFLALGLVQMLVAVLLAAVCWAPGGRFPGQQGPRALPASAVTMAVALGNGFCAGFALLAAQLVGIRWDRWGQELALIEAFVMTLLAWAAALGIWIARRRGRGNADELPARTSPEGEQPDGVTEALRAQVAAARGKAEAAKTAPQLVTVFAALFLVSSLAVILLRFDPGAAMADWIQPPEPGVLSWAAAVLLPAVALGAVWLVWHSSRKRALRRTIAAVWDVLTFWPRRYHPFAVRPFTERAVPEFQRLITERIRSDGGLIVSAHSQGSALAFAALAPMGSAMLHRCGLLTYGSPVTTLYGQVFPAYFGQTAVEDLCARLAAGRGGWVNHYRLTDPIGGPVIGSGDPDVDLQLPDPAEPAAPLGSPTSIDPGGLEQAPLSAQLNPASVFAVSGRDPEPLRPVWADVAGHQLYRKEAAYKQAVADFRTGLG
ncbi:hypothetical protein [Nesterenkonia ebinurensis]|uniref:hypothetical protein n=1 Tax=Nesterenkonia ebinurensis TaxID=2608252 RepID=UPI00123DB658|nr:hypothetical protein [Nesterenkonia ebinurensis]